MGISILDRCLKLTINMQIRVGITFVVLIAIIISMLLLTMSNIIQYYNFSSYYENIIQDEDNKMLLNYEQYIHTIESTVERKAKSDLEFYRNLEKMYFENLEGLELTDLLNENLESSRIKDYNELNEDKKDENEIEEKEKCFDSNYLKCIIYKFYGNEGGDYKENKNFKKMVNYYNLIFPLLNSTLSENCIGVFNLKQYYNFQFYKKIYSNDNQNLIGNILFFAGINETKFDSTYNPTQYINTIQSNILDNLLNLFIVIPNFNKKYDLKYILSHMNTEFSSIPQITSKHILEDDESNPYIMETNKKIVKIKENDLSFESKIFNFKPFDSSSFLIFQPILLHNISDVQYNSLIANISNIFYEKMEDLMVIKWSDRFFENLVNDIFGKYKTILNIFSLLFSPFATIKENLLKNINYFFDDNNGIFLTKTILEKFSCMYIIKKELVKTENDFEKLNSFNITTCNIKFNDDFEEYLRNNQTEIDIFERKKVKVDLVQYDIEYIYFYSNKDGPQEEKRKINFDLSKSEDKDTEKNLNSFKIFQGIYPLNSLNTFSSFLYNNIIFINFYFTDLYSNFFDMKTIRDICYTYFFQIILISSAGLWLILLLIIIIIVLKISHSISDPIDKLIQPVPMNDNSSRELNKYFQNISYTDDSTINELFVLCKKLIVGGFKSEEDYKQKKKNNNINSYNNISLVKTNNMIINENEILKGEKNKEINFFEEQNNQKNKYKILNNLATNSIYKSKKLKYKVLSEALFTGKFYQNNRKYLIKDRESFDILNNEMISQKKKNLDDIKQKKKKNSFISIFKDN